MIYPKAETMSKLDEYELKILSDFEKGKLKSVVTKRERAKLKAAARATEKTRPATKRRKKSKS